MKVKTSISLSEDVLEGITALAGEGNRSTLIEQILRNFLANQRRAKREQKELAILNKNAVRLNAEVLDALEFQDEP